MAHYIRVNTLIVSLDVEGGPRARAGSDRLPTVAQAPAAAAQTR